MITPFGKLIDTDIEACVDAAEIERHLAELRREFIEATPRQRLSTAKQRIQNPEQNPNRLIAFVSAAEGFARSLCMHQRARTKAELSTIYHDYWRRGAKDLIVEYLSSRSLGEPAAFFGEKAWKLFSYAVEYRNLLAHECTYLGNDRSPELIEACRTVIKMLSADKGLDANDI
jgi:hypothetical protein